MAYRIFRVIQAPANDMRRPKAGGVYEWVGDESGFVEGNEYRPTGMSKIESAARWWFTHNAPVEPGYYVAVPWGYEDQIENHGLPFGFTVKAEEMVAA
ncbi:MAG TPA: hypothetical protein VFP65_11265 [Anaeromyxobacteraceae bacterium]|nr:hypothetical protein [Anaeromyxobacteraceae bacterium]